MKALFIGLTLFSTVGLAATPIVTLEFRNEKVTISKESGKTLYTVKKLDGTIISDRLTTEELQVQRPEIYNHLKQGIAPVVQSEWPYYIDATK